MSVGAESYLYNKGAGAYLVGANEWGTRASVSTTAGHKVYVQKFESGDVAWDGKTYFITNYVEQGGMKGQVASLYFTDDNAENLWVDQATSASANNQGFTFEAQDDGTYKIGVSDKNKMVNPTDYPDSYLGVIPAKNDTRVYLCDPGQYTTEELAEAHTVWYFVTPENYAAHVAAVKRYDAAMALGEVIAEAGSYAVDAATLASAKGVYGDTSSTLDALNSAAAALRQAIFEAKLNVATVASPVEVLSLLGIATDFNDSDYSGWTSTTSASNKQASNGNNAADYAATGNHYENWNWDAFSVGKVSATATGLPAGVYHLNALAFANVTGGTYLYAGGYSAPVNATQIDMEKPTDVYAIVTGNTLEIGLDVRVKGPNWIGLDNVGLYYLGNTSEAYRYIAETAIASDVDYEALVAEGSVYCEKSLLASYLSAKSALTGASSAAAAADALTAFNAASVAMAESAGAYGKYKDVCDDAEAKLAALSNTNAAADILGDYLIDDTAAEGSFNGNGGAVYILENGLLTTAQIAAETEYVSNLLKVALATDMADGDDCTTLLENPKFAEAGGWTSVVGPTWPDGDTSTFPVMSANNMVCDVYQTLTGLQNGLYEFDLQAAFRPGADYSEEYEAGAQAYAYINSYETKIASGSADNINEPAEASAAFAAGKYPTRVYGLVTDGTMRIGVTNKVRTNENCRLWAGGATLTFRAKNETVLAEVIALTVPKAQALLANYAGRPEIDALSAAISEAQSPADSYAALVALKKAMENVEAGTLAYTNFKVALGGLSSAIANNTTADKVTISKAQALLDKAQAAYDAQTYGTAEAEQAISDLNAAVVSIKMGGEQASEDNPVDYTSVIVNPTFDPAKGDKGSTYIEGWVTTAMNGYKENTVSYNKAGFELNQKLSGLPKGKYKVRVHSYYRAGYYYDEEQYIASGTETHLTTLYAETSEKKYTTPVMNLTEGATAENHAASGKSYTLSDGRYAPDGTTGTVEWFNAGCYLNELTFTVPADGEVTIGLSKTETLANDYEVVGAWSLLYMGDDSAGEKVTDVTDLIVNPTFDPAKGDKNSTYIEGWTTTAMNGYKEKSVSYNKAGFELNQTLTGLPAGKYYATVHTYYRAGYYYDEEQYIASGTETHLTTLYAETSEKKYTTPVMNLTEGATAENHAASGKYYTLSNGRYAPDGTTGSVEWFAAGAYLNRIDFTVPEDGKVTIGLSKTETLANDYAVVGAWHLYKVEADEPDATDVTALIVNPTFDPAKGDKNSTYIEGWVTTAMNGYKENSVSYNKAGFELSQKLTGLPEGTYKVTVHTYYRAGYYNEEEQYIASGTETHLTTLYAETSEKKYTTPVMNLTEGATAENHAASGKYYTLANGLYAPDGTTGSVEWFAAGAYLNELPFYVGADGEATIGLSKTETLANDYAVVGAWSLYYYGPGNSVDKIATGIEDIRPNASSAEMTPVAYYSLSGVRLSAPQKGINIVRMSNGQTVKMLVR